MDSIIDSDIFSSENILTVLELFSSSPQIFVVLVNKAAGYFGNSIACNIYLVIFCFRLSVVRKPEYSIILILSLQQQESDFH